MKKTLIALAALAVFAATPALAAKGDKWLGLQLGGSFPTSDFKDAAKTGFDGTVTGTYMVVPQVGVGVDVGYHMWNGSDALNAGLQSLTSDPGAKGKFSAIQGTAHVLYDIPTSGKAIPYLKGGVGVYSLKAKVESNIGNASTTSSKLGFNLGGGVNFNVSPMYDVGVGAAYHIIQTEGTSTKLYTVGVNLLWGMGAK